MVMAHAVYSVGLPVMFLCFISDLCKNKCRNGKSERNDEVNGC